MKKLLVVLGPLILFLTSCASIVSKSSYCVNIGSEPSGAKFIIKDELDHSIATGTTPSNVLLDASDGFFCKAKYYISMELKDYKPIKYPLQAKLDPWYFGNIPFGGLVGLLIVDPVTGAMWKLPPTISYKLEPDESATSATSATTAQSNDNSIIQGGTTALEYPKAYVIDEAKKYDGIPRQRPAISLSESEMRYLYQTPISINPGQFSLEGQWNGSVNTITSKNNAVEKIKTNVEYVFADNGRFVQTENTGVLKKTTGKWEYTPTHITMREELPKTEDESEATENYGSTEWMIIRWYDEDTIEILYDNLEGIASKIKQNNPQIRSCEVWYDEDGNSILKIVVKAADDNSPTTMTSVTGRLFLKRQSSSVAP